MYYENIQEFLKLIHNFSKMLDKAEAHAEARRFDPNNYLGARLTLDMFPFVRQVQSFCDTAKFSAARASGKEAPRHPDTEQTLKELRGRLQSTADYLATFRPEDFHGADERRVVLPWMKEEGQHLLARDYFVEMAVPNFYFHLCMAYALLRQAGVPIGKQDYLGSLSLRRD